MQIILISGKAQHGKSESAKLIKSKLEKQNNKVLITAYGNLVKFVCEKFFGGGYQKNDHNRSLWQYIGTDIIRKQFPNYWVDFVIEIVSMFPNEWDYVIIDDCRFPNEFERWEEKNWDVVKLRVERLNFKSPLTPKQQKHISETILDNYNFDYIIQSKSGLNNLKKEVSKFIRWVEDNK
jgi:hypothetical protein